MDDLELKAEFITPAFIGGADPRGTPELRAPSLRGALRYWLRALLSDQNVDDLRQAEGRVFGRTGKGGGASAVVVRPNWIKKDEKTVTDWIPKGYPDPKPKQPAPGLHYAFFSLKGKEKDGVITTPHRRGFAGTFTLTLSRRPGVFSYHAMLRAYAALWCLSRLGGVGARSRRGVGALQLEPEGALPSWVEGLPAMEVQAETPAALRDEIAAGLAAFRERLGLPAGPVTSSEYDMLVPGACSIYLINNSYDTAINALSAVAGGLARYRYLRPPDYSLVKPVVATGAALTGTVERAAFGLPIVFFYSSLPIGFNTGSLEATQKIKRRSSPLLFRPVRLKNGKFAVVIVFFKSRLLPAGVKLSIKGKTGLLPTLAPVVDFLTRNISPAPATNPSLPEQGFSLLEVLP